MEKIRYHKVGLWLMLNLKFSTFILQKHLVLQNAVNCACQYVNIGPLEPDDHY